MPETNNKLNIVLVDVNKIIPYWRNPRRNDKTVDILCEVIPQYGFNVPIVLDKQNVIVKGHARLRAAKRLGMKEVPCIYSENDDETNKADRIADNKIQEMSFWDIAKLEMEFQRIGDLKFDKLFHEEDYNPFNIQPEKSLTFQGVSLDDYGDYASDSDDETFEQFHVTEDSPQQAVMEVDIPSDSSQENDTSVSNSSMDSENNNIIPDEFPRAKKVLRTICPYCGADVYITL